MAHAELPKRPENGKRLTKIACLGWGSLIWDPRELPIRRYWFDDGPLAQIEFTRKSSDERITLVIDSKAEPVRLLWAQMLPMTLQGAKEALRDREGLREVKGWEAKIKGWSATEKAPSLIPGLADWARAHEIEAVVWTSLSPKFDDKDRPTIEDVVAHLKSLNGTMRENAERYIRRAPLQIDTEYRRRIEAELGWTYQPA